MRIPGLKTLKRLGRQWRSRLVRSGLILGYHRVANTAVDPFNLCVSPDQFADHMAYLSRHTTPLPLAELAARAQQGTLPNRAVAVTFDDGYRDNLTTALPILEAHAIPATIFVTTGALGGEFWWERLQRWHTQTTPAQRQTAVPHLPRHDLLTLYRWLLSMDQTARDDILARLQEQAGAADTAVSTVLTATEVAQLSQHPLITIGSHSVSHPRLSQLDRAAQAAELRESKRVLEQIVAQPVTAFSYPNGLYTAVTLDLLRETSYELACCSFTDSVWRHSSLDRLPRIWTQNVPIRPLVQRWLK